MNTKYLYVKRITDIVLAAAGIFICLPLLALIYYIIKLDSEGPAIFVQERAGKDGKTFKMYKFRTMVSNASELKDKYLALNEAKPPLFKIKNDPRLTRIGNFLRNTNLDELPQLFNVLKGEMSLVGPRPFLYEEFVQFKPWQKERAKSRPGMTSLWHGSGRYMVPSDLVDWVRTDIEYIEKMNLFLDTQILLKTMHKVFININDVVMLGLRKIWLLTGA